MARFGANVFRPGKGEGDTTDDSLGYDFEFPHPGGSRTTVEGEFRPPCPPSVAAPLTARHTAFPKLGSACQTPAHRLPVGRQSANITVADLQGGIRFAGSVGWAGAPGESGGVRKVWALTGCSGQSVVVYGAWRCVFVLFGSDGESSGDPAGWPQIRLDSGAAL